MNNSTFHMEPQKSKIAETILDKQNNAGRVTNLELKIYSES